MYVSTRGTAVASHTSPFFSLFFVVHAMIRYLPSCCGKCWHLHPEPEHRTNPPCLTLRQPLPSPSPTTTTAVRTTLLQHCCMMTEHSRTRLTTRPRLFVVCLSTGLRREATRVAEAQEERHQRHRINDIQSAQVRRQGEEDNRASRPVVLQGERRCISFIDDVISRLRFCELCACVGFLADLDPPILVPYMLLRTRK